MTFREKIVEVQKQTKHLKKCQKFIVRIFSYKGGHETVEFHSYDDMTGFVASIRGMSDSCVVEGVYSQTLWDCM